MLEELAKEKTEMQAEKIEVCKDCQGMIREKLEQNCEECGDAVCENDLEFCQLGLDVIALFPNITVV